MTVRLSGAVVGASTVLLLCLAGCAAPGGDAGTDEPSGVSPPAAPSVLIDLTCDHLVERSVIDTVLSPEARELPVAVWGAGSILALAQVGALQSGALSCEWVDGEGSTERLVQVAVLPHARQSWAAVGAEGPLLFVQDSADRYGDASWHGCLNACYADALVGDTWVGTIVSGPLDNLDLVTAAAIEAVAAAASIEPSWSTDATAPADCETALPLNTVNTVLGSPVDPWTKDDPTRTLYFAGFVQAGGLHCAWRNDFASASAMTAELSILPGGGWAWQDYLSSALLDGYTREPIDGLGDDAWVACQPDGDCAVDVLVGDTWIDMLVNDEAGATDRDKAEQLATAVVAALAGGS